MTRGPSKPHQLYPSHTSINNTAFRFLNPLGQPCGFFPVPGIHPIQDFSLRLQTVWAPIKQIKEFGIVIWTSWKAVQ